MMVKWFTLNTDWTKWLVVQEFEYYADRKTLSVKINDRVTNIENVMGVRATAIAGGN